jgi:hypothetical protein
MSSAKNRIPPNPRISSVLTPDGHSQDNSAPPIRTAGELFPDGGAIELILDKNDHLALLAFDGQKHQVGRRIETRGRVFEPAEVHPSILRALTLPTKCAPYGSTRKLFTGVSELISRVTGLPENVVTPFVFFVFATWLVESLSLAPFLWVVVPSTASCDALLQLLCLLCRRAMHMADLTTAGLRSLPMQLKPTIVTDVLTVTPDLIRALRASSRPKTYLPIGDGIADLFCARIVFANQPLRDPALAGFPLEIVLAPTREFVPPMSSADAERVTAEFQPKFLMYRLSNHGKVTRPNHLDLGEVTAPTRALAYTLAAAIVGDDKLQSRIVPLLKSHDRQIQIDRSTLLEAFALEALLAACHSAKRQSLSVTELTQSVNTILVGRGDSLQVSPEAVGWRLRALGLHTDFIAGGRKGLSLTDKTRTRIHGLAAAYGVRTLRQGVIAGLCAYCDGTSGPPAESSP